MSKRITNFPLPDVMGNDLETSVNLDFRVKQPDPDLEGEFVESQFWGIPTTDSPVSITKSLPQELNTGSDFTTNGFKFYDGIRGKHQGFERIEVATPEVIDPQELTAYMRAGEIMVDQAVINYINSYNQGNEYDLRIAGARIQNRVKDGFGNSWGCHDNF